MTNSDSTRHYGKWRLMVPFADLGHQPKSANSHIYGPNAFVCLKCGNMDGSRNGMFPCGDELGETVTTLQTLRDGKHSFDLVWRGRVIAWRHRDD